MHERARASAGRGGGHRRRGGRKAPTTALLALAGAGRRHPKSCAAASRSGSPSSPRASCGSSSCDGSGRWRCSAGDFAEIDARSQEVLARAPDDPVAFVARKHVLERRNDEAACWRCSGRARRRHRPIRRASPARRFEAGRLCERLYDVAAASADYEAALVADSDHVSALDALADLSYRTRHLSRARALYAQLADRGSSLGRDEICRRRAELAEAAGDLDEAESSLCRGGAGQPVGSAGARGAGAAGAVARRRSAGSHHLKTVLELLPLDAVDRITELRRQLGELAVKLKQREQARNYYEMVLAQDPARRTRWRRWSTSTSRPRSGSSPPRRYSGSRSWPSSRRCAPSSCSAAAKCCVRAWAISIAPMTPTSRRRICTLPTRRRCGGSSPTTITRANTARSRRWCATSRRWGAVGGGGDAGWARPRARRRRSARHGRRRGGAAARPAAGGALSAALIREMAELDAGLHVQRGRWAAATLDGASSAKRSWPSCRSAPTRSGWLASASAPIEVDERRARVHYGVLAFVEPNGLGAHRLRELGPALPHPGPARAAAPSVGARLRRVRRSWRWRPSPRAAATDRRGPDAAPEWHERLQPLAEQLGMPAFEAAVVVELKDCLGRALPSAAAAPIAARPRR